MKKHEREELQGQLAGALLLMLQKEIEREFDLKISKVSRQAEENMEDIKDI